MQSNKQLQQTLGKWDPPKLHDATRTCLKAFSVVSFVWTSTPTIPLPVLPLVFLLFYMSSSNADSMYFLWSLHLPRSRCHTQPLGCCSTPSFSKLVWRQAAGVLWLEDQRASERWSPSERGCVGGGEKVYTHVLQTASSVPQERRRAYRTRRPQSHKLNFSSCVRPLQNICAFFFFQAAGGTFY